MTTDPLPLVSCIMPTFDRREFIPGAIAYFQRQDYPNTQLIVIDDGTDEISDLIPADERIQYIRLPQRLSVGAKRNLACEQSVAPLIAHWDDDDWQAPHRLSHQVDHLLNSKAAICGLKDLLFFDIRDGKAWQYNYPDGQRPWLSGNSLVYTREFWTTHRFPEINVGEDGSFVWSASPNQIATMGDSTFHVGIIHGKNVSPKHITGAWWRPHPVDDIQRILGDDWGNFAKGLLYQITTQHAPADSITPPASRPLVSCIMPTRDRRKFVKLALQCFDKQDYFPRELIIVDDGSEAIEDLVLQHPDVRYIRLTKRHSIGAKRNYGCQNARGSVVVHWDDDDWYGIHRLSAQVAPIISGKVHITGLDARWIFLLQKQEFWTVSTDLHRRMFVGDVHGGTLAFAKSVWDDGARYPDVDLAEDAFFLLEARKRGARLIQVANNNLFVYTRHASNAWNFQPGDFLDPKGWSRNEPPEEFSVEQRDLYTNAAFQQLNEGPTSHGNALRLGDTGKSVLNLLVGFYSDPAAERQAEFLECLDHNLANPAIGKLHVFLEDAVTVEQSVITYPMLGHPNICLIPHGRRLTFRCLFDYANHNLPGQLVVVSNADIYFDRTLERIVYQPMDNCFACLSRWDVLSDGSTRLFEYPFSQDAWIFRAPLAVFPSEFILGKPGCDNRLAWEAHNAGLNVINPSFSIRAFHLHLSAIRRYTEQQRITGPALAVPATSLLNSQWLWFVVPCMGRKADLEVTLKSLTIQPKASVVLVDYGCSDHCGDWARGLKSAVTVVRATGATSFCGARARNLGARATDPDALLCFLDADLSAMPAFSLEVLRLAADHIFLVVADNTFSGLGNMLVCSRSVFDRLGGFDESFEDWGMEVAEFKARLKYSGLTERSISSELLRSLPTGVPRPNFQRMPDRKTTLSIHSTYTEIMSCWFQESGGMTLSASARSEIYKGIERQRMVCAGLASEISYANVVFSERMGYAVCRLEKGISSHINDTRPFRSIPEALRGRNFTQVVAFRVSPIEVEFESPGKLFVLVGTDWGGSREAIAWLAQFGCRESLPLLETERGTGFEVWSLSGSVGERFVIPTQVALVAERLIRR